MPTVSKCQGGNSKPGLTHSKIHWLQKKMCGYRKKRSLTTEPGTVRGPAMPCPPSVGSLSPTYPSWPAVLPSPWPGSENTPGAQRSKGREELVTPLAQWQPAAHSIRAKPRAREVDTSGTHRALICLEICKTDLISGHWSWPRTGMRSQEKTSVSVTGLQSWKEMEGSSHPKHSSGRSGNWGPREARSHAQLHNSLFKRKDHIFVSLLLVIVLLIFSKMIPDSGFIPVPANPSAIPTMLDPSVLRGGGHIAKNFSWFCLEFCWPFPLPEMPFLHLLFSTPPLHSLSLARELPFKARVKYHSLDDFSSMPVNLCISSSEPLHSSSGTMGKTRGLQETLGGALCST